MISYVILIDAAIIGICTAVGALWGDQLSSKRWIRGCKFHVQDVTLGAFVGLSAGALFVSLYHSHLI
jgi:hypothetical protein